MAELDGVEVCISVLKLPHIISSILKPSFFLLIGIYTLVNWISMTYLIRAEFYREKAKPYVAAALSMGQSNFKIMFKHILANSLVPIITYFPFSVVAGISALVGLDYLGFGLAPPTPSWGQMLDVGLSNISKWWMVFSPVSAQFFTLLAFFLLIIHIVLWTSRNLNLVDSIFNFLKIVNFCHLNFKFVQLACLLQLCRRLSSINCKH